MKLMFAVSSVALFLHLLLAPFQEKRYLNAARGAMQSGQFEQAMRYVDQASLVEPQLYTAEAAAVCSDVLMAWASHLVDGPVPDFVTAATMAQSVKSRCGTTDREGDVARFLEQIATQHVAWATSRCQQHDFSAALTAFQYLATLPYPERILQQAQEETGWCRLALASVLAQQKEFEPAVEELQRAASTDNSQVRATARQKVTPIVAEEMDDWVQQQHYARAFQQLTKYQQWFAADPVTMSRLAGLESRLEYRVFGVALRRSCMSTGMPQRPVVQTVQHTPGKKTAPQKPASAPQGPVMFTATAGGGTGDTQSGNLALRNTTTHPLRLLFRDGPELRHVPLEIQTPHTVQLDPGDYAVAIFDPEDCRARPARMVLTVPEWERLYVEFTQSEQ
jgi:hypothetical protein